MTRVRSDISGSGAAAAFALLVRDLLLPDFVEPVPTYFSYKFKLRKELIVYCHDIALKRTDYGVGNIILSQDSQSVRRSGIYALNLSFALRKLKTVCPNMSGITQQRSSSCQKYRMIMNWRMNDNYVCRHLVFY